MYLVLYISISQLHSWLTTEMLDTPSQQTRHCILFISSYGAPLAQRVSSYLALHSSLFGPDSAVSYDYIILTALTLC